MTELSQNVASRKSIGDTDWADRAALAGPAIGRRVSTTADAVSAQPHLADLTSISRLTKQFQQSPVAIAGHAGRSPLGTGQPRGGGNEVGQRSDIGVASGQALIRRDVHLTVTRRTNGHDRECHGRANATRKPIPIGTASTHAVVFSARLG
jgi:hypothetical protein